MALSPARVRTISGQEFRAETRRAKRLLEDIAGCRVLGYRAASYSIVRESLWAWTSWWSWGSSTTEHLSGTPRSLRHPERRAIPTGCRCRRRIDRGVAACDRALVRLQATRGGRGYFRLLPYWLTRWGLASINRSESQPFIFYLHPWEIDPDQPRVAASLLSASRHYTILGKCEARLQRLLGDFRFGTVRDGLEKLGLLPSAVAAR